MLSVVAEINRFMVGWRNYFELAQAKVTLAELDKWIRRKLRCLKLKQCKRAKAIARFLKGRGVGADAAWMLAASGKGWWRLAKTRQSHVAMGQEWFRELGLISLANEYSLKPA